MFSGNVTSGMTFRYNFVFVAITSVAIVLLTAFVYQIVQRAMLEELRDEITEEVRLMERISQDEGPDELAKVGFLNDPRNFTSIRLFGLFDEDGNKFAGNLKAPPETLGWVRQDFEGLYPEPNGKYLIASKQIPQGLTVVVGRSLTPVNRVLEILLFVMLTTAAAAAAIRMVISYGISRQTFIKLAAISATLEKVSDGDLNARVNVGNGGEQLDKTARLINTQLERLKRVMEVNQNTISAIAHDLRSPLNRVSILINEALRENDAAMTEKHLVEAQTEITGLTEVFDTTLRISKLKASIGNEGFSRISLDDLVTEMGEIFAPVVEDQGDTLRVMVSGEQALTVFADSRMLRQMLVNLIENATNHCPEGVTITLCAKAADNGSAVLEVSDTGPGIPANQRLAVLEPFQRLDRSRSTPGTGLGLALVAAIAGRHGANIELADNNPGLVVRILFPLPNDAGKLSKL
ncbi:HAMP domain-containing sensor histidine kinase [uncultured Hoeflea sp.]|mgnify:CR=1 FL=1|uniref:HAMP domain-containing sensor histidine kinase n=1 Tax=uncultured Hoeflea sp. TaxID=538666 RepID=UPI0030DD268D|tara:strand:- start:2643 stop:4031 length:1389 start_codon:yes stop_codon:yes gene_type:complete